LCCPEFLFKIKLNDNAQHDAFSASESERRPSLDIELRTHKGFTLLLPRCFCGLVTIQPSPEQNPFSPTLKKRTALLSDVLSDVQGISVYFVGDRPRSWMSWPTDYDDKEGEEAALGASSDPEESLNKLSVSGWDFESEIYWEGERGLSL
jgi:hypothetical protein